MSEKFFFRSKKKKSGKNGNKGISQTSYDAEYTGKKDPIG